MQVRRSHETWELKRNEALTTMTIAVLAPESPMRFDDAYFILMMKSCGPHDSFVVVDSVHTYYEIHKKLLSGSCQLLIPRYCWRPALHGNILRMRQS